MQEISRVQRHTETEGEMPPSVDSTTSPELNCADGVEHILPMMYH